MQQKNPDNSLARVKMLQKREIDLTKHDTVEAKTKLIATYPILAKNKEDLEKLKQSV